MAPAAASNPCQEGAHSVTTRRDQVYRAVTRTGPDYVPIYLFNKDQEQSDIVAIGVQHHFMGPKADTSGVFAGSGWTRPWASLWRRSSAGARTSPA